MFGRFVVERREVIYRLGGVDPDEGVDVYDLVPYLTKFNDLVRESVRKSGYDGELHVRIKPFKEGSFITEFLIEGGLTSLLSGNEATAIANALAFLGFAGSVGKATIPRIVRAVKGRTDKFRKNEDGTYTYGSGKDAVTVGEAEHDLVQSPKIADLYGNVSVGPIAKFDGKVDQVSIYVLDRNDEDDGLSKGATFTRSDASDMATYAKSAELADELDVQEVTYTNGGVWLRPLSGPYSGAERGYTFLFGEGDETIKYKSVRIDDDDFREKLEDGTVRFNSGDMLRVDLEVTRHVTRSGRTSASYRITTVLDYKPLKMPRQETFSEFLDGGGGEGARSDEAE